MDEKKSVLIVDDDESTRETLTLIFEKEGYDTETAATGRRALNKAQRQFFNVALLDIKLPDMVGVELLAPLKGMHPNMVVIMVTAYASQETAVLALKEGASAYITKPLNMDEVLTTVRDALGKQRLATKKRVLEQALRESEEFNSSLLSNAPNPIIVVNPDTSVRYVNPALERLTGFSSTELIGRKTPYPWWTRETLQQTSSDLQKALRKGTQTLEELFQKKNGEHFWVEITSTPVRSDEGLKYFVGNWVDITERKKAEEEIKQKAGLATHNPAPVLQARYNGTIVGINPAAKKLFKKDVTGESLYDFFSGLDALCIKSIKDGTPFQFEGRIGKRTFLLTIKKDRQTRSLYIYGSDITEPKRVEKALRESEERYRSFVQGFQGIAFRSKLDFSAVFFHGAVDAITGYTEEEFIAGRPSWGEVIHPEDWPKIYESVERARLIPNYSTEREYRIIRKDGQTRWVHEMLQNICDNTGKPIFVQGALYDITERKKMEEALTESEAKYRALFQESRDAIYITTRAGKLLDVNKSYLDLFGYSREEIRELQIKDTYVDPVKRKRFRREIEQKGFVRDYEVKLRKRDRTQMDCLLTATVRRANDGSIVGYQGIIRDITERKRADEELKESFARLRRSLEATVSTLASAVETRDPYTAGHQRRVTELACAIATEMGLSEEQIDGIRLAALVHDVGKIYVPTEILSRPGKLSEIEYAMIKTHPQVSYNVLKKIEFPGPVAQTVLQHHERMDGSGYPQGLSGDEIHPEARILAVADVVEAMASYRPYRPALSIEDALEEISQSKGVLYDSAVGEACVKVFSENGFKLEYE